MSVKGYAIHDTRKWSDFKLISYDLKTAGDYDIDIAVTHCGICGSDLHTIKSEWGKPDLPVVVGHEIVGTVTRVSPKVTEFQVGDRAGVSAQVSSCFNCKNCNNDNENYCPKQVDTYNAKYPNGDKAMGGFSTAVRVHERFVFPIPDQLPSEIAAPMLCAGLTTYSPLVRNDCGPGKKVGVIGIGGLGHFAIMWAKALGAEVYALTSSADKDDDIKKLGGDYILHTAEPDFADPYQGELDIIIMCANITTSFPLKKALTLLAVGGHMICDRLPQNALPEIAPFDLSGGCAIGGSHIGSKKEVIAMLELACKQNLRSWIEVLPMSKAKGGVEKVDRGDVRYRVVLKNDINASAASA